MQKKTQRKAKCLDEYQFQWMNESEFLLTKIIITDFSGDYAAAKCC